jgi:NAD(P)-dependent dehydrogenase (short-subunit alcohol dehydrogenase family)
MLLLATFLALVLTEAVTATTAAPPNAIIVGGSSGMGKAAALSIVERGGKCLLISRSAEKLADAQAYLISQVPDAHVETAILDIRDEEAVEAFSETHLTNEGCWDGLVISAAGRAPHGLMSILPTEETRQLLETKLWGAYHCAKYMSSKLQAGGCVVFVAGILNRRPGINCAPLAICNGALEGLTRSLALEWGPQLRVNCLSPGFCDTERFDHMTTEQKEKMMASTAASLPLQRVGEPRDMGEAIYFLLTAKFCTGVILDVDGGHGIRQYASMENDPMRTGVATSSEES